MIQYMQGDESVKISPLQWIKNNSVMLLNTGSLIGTMLVTSGLGFAFWWLAARRFSTQAVGLASAATSAMMLLSTVCMLGLGTLLITELPRNRGQEGSWISFAVILVGGVGLVVGTIFALLAPFVSPDLQPLGANIVHILLFAAGVSLSAVTVILDQAVIGLLRGDLQFWRNTLFTVAKLVILALVSLLLAQHTGMSIYAAWALGNVVSLIPLVIFALSKSGGSLKRYVPQWGILRKFGTAAIQHHILNLIILAPTQALPILVTILLSAQVNAWFYVSSMMANFVFSISTSLTMVLHAENAAQSATLAHKARLTIGLAAITSIVVNALLIVAAAPILGFFGASYATHAALSLRILTFGAFPLIIKNHYISMRRIKDEITNAMVPISIGCVLELGAAGLGAHVAGLTGLSAGWVLAMGVEALLMAPLVLKTVMGKSAAAESALNMYMDVPTERMAAIGMADIVDTPTIALRNVIYMDATTQVFSSVRVRERSTEEMNKIVSAPTIAMKRLPPRGTPAKKLPAATDKQTSDVEYDEGPTVKMPEIVNPIRKRKIKSELMDAPTQIMSRQPRRDNTTSIGRKEKSLDAAAD